MRSLMLALVSLCAPVFAMTLNDLSIGTHVTGPKLAPKDLKGKVVFVVYWGTHCGYCLAELPNWAAAYKKHAGEGFEIIGLECQGSTAAEISTLTKARNAEFETTLNGNLKGANVTGIPHGFLFGPDGKLIQDGGMRGPEFEQKVAEALKQYAAEIAAKARDAAAKAAAASVVTAEKQCKSWLSLADAYITNGNPAGAKEYLNKIVDKYGETAWAAEAKKRLETIK
ncbi:MAG TPA: TlpA disulfide reductase family protein [Planctomycetota bacterium]|nr:TlpA disulfide reductase family protein [Planctomycetota bacterium]